MKVNEIIRIRRNELNMNQKALADACGVTVATISRWESGGRTRTLCACIRTYRNDVSNYMSNLSEHTYIIAQKIDGTGAPPF